MESVEEIHAKIMDNFNLMKRLNKWNKGWNLINISDKKEEAKRYHVDVYLKVEMNLVETKAEAIVKSNLPFVDWRYHYDESEPKSFLNDFKEWSLVPVYNPRRYNRSNRYFGNERQVQYGEHPFMRQKNIDFQQIDVTIYPEAEKYMEKVLVLPAEQFRREIKSICKLQRTASDEESKDFDGYMALMESINDLKAFAGKKVSEYSYRSYDSQKLLSLNISKKEYNNRLSGIEKELKQLIQKYPFLKKAEDVSYFDLKQKTTEKEWIQQNKQELQEGYEANDGEATFKEYCHDSYECWLESGDFDDED